MNNHQTSTKKYEPQSSSDIITIVVQQNIITISKTNVIIKKQFHYLE